MEALQDGDKSIILMLPTLLLAPEEPNPCGGSLAMWRTLLQN